MKRLYTYELRYYSKKHMEWLVEHTTVIADRQSRALKKFQKAFPEHFEKAARVVVVKLGRSTDYQKALDLCKAKTSTAQSEVSA